VKQEDINLEIDGNVVRVSADYKVPDEYSGDDVKWHRAGRPFGCVLYLRTARLGLLLTSADAGPARSIHTRSLRFPDSCDMSKVDAKFSNGSLCVRLNKKPEAKTHRIQIGGSAQQPQSIEAGQQQA